MEQLINNMLANTQLPQAAPPVKKSEPAQKDGFQKLLEQKQTDGAQAPKQEKTDAAPQKPQEAQDAQRTQETGETAPAAPKDGKVLEEQMVLAAMAMLQNPVTPVEQVLTPEVQAEAAAAEIVPVAAEVLLTPEAEARNAAPEGKAQIPEALVEGGERQAVDQTLAEELPQAIEAPEAARETEGRTVEVKVETGRAEVQETETSDTEETPELQGAETEAPVFEDVKAVPVKVGEAPKAAETETENIGKQIGPKLIEITSVTGEAGGQSVTIDLDPANLGRLQIEVGLSKDGTLYVHVNAENSRTQSLLSRNSESLAAILGKYTQQEVRVEVPRQEESQRQDLYEQQQEQHRRQQQERRRKQESGEDFLQQLRLGLIPLDGE